MRVIQVDLNRDYSDAIREAVAVLRAGGVVVYPTDTLYGLGANGLDPDAVEKVFSIKHRSRSKPLPILVRNMLWAKETAQVSPRNEQLLEQVWPGKITAVLPRKGVVPDALTAGHDTVGMRVAEHPLVDELLGRFGYPLTSTSANISGDEPTGDIGRIVVSLSDGFIKPDLVIDAGVLPPSQPSTIVDLTTDKPKILRVGASKPEELLKLFQKLNGLQVS